MKEKTYKLKILESEVKAIIGALYWASEEHNYLIRHFGVPLVKIASDLTNMVNTEDSRRRAKHE